MNCATLEKLELKLRLEDDLYSVLAFDNYSIIGIGRVTGDGTSYFYVQDLIVHPKYRGKGVGRMLMEYLEYYFECNVPKYAYIGLIAAIGAKGFYKRFGFLERANKSQGMYKFYLRQE